MLLKKAWQKRRYYAFAKNGKSMAKKKILCFCKEW